MFTLPKKDILTDWIELDEKTKIKVDYPQGKQIHDLQDLSIAVASDPTKFVAYMRMYLKYTIKDWKYLLNVGGEEIECKVIGNELADSVWYTLTSDPTIVTELYTRIEEQLRWVDKDKKK